MKQLAVSLDRIKTFNLLVCTDHWIEMRECERRIKRILGYLQERLRAPSEWLHFISGGNGRAIITGKEAGLQFSKPKSKLSRAQFYLVLKTFLGGRFVEIRTIKTVQVGSKTAQGPNVSQL